MNTHVTELPQAKAKSPFIKRAWYVAALSSDVDAEALFSRRLLDIPVLIYRKQDGAPVALRDRCPHRFVPLSAGKRNGDGVVCPYHALEFNAVGKCTRSPHGTGVIPKAAQVRAFPLVEKHGFIWIWMADEEADFALLPDYSPLDNGPPTGIGYTYMYLKANYELIIDNVMDLSHVDHVHGEIITTRGQLSPIVPQMKEGDDTVGARWEWRQTPPLGILANFLPKPDDTARHFIEVNWSRPANIQLTVGATQDDGLLNLDHCVGQYDLHVTTPETETTTHYWFATRRNHLEDDAEFNVFKIKAMHDAFVNEDFPLIEAAGRAMETTDFLSLNPVLISSDAAPVKVRRIVKTLIEKENAG